MNNPASVPAATTLQNKLKYTQGFLFIELAVLLFATLGSFGLFIDMPGDEWLGISAVSFFSLDFCAVLMTIILLNKKKLVSLVIGQVVNIVNILVCLFLLVISFENGIFGIIFGLITLVLPIAIIASLREVKAGLKAGIPW